VGIIRGVLLDTAVSSSKKEKVVANLVFAVIIIFFIAYTIGPPFLLFLYGVKFADPLVSKGGLGVLFGTVFAFTMFLSLWLNLGLLRFKFYGRLIKLEYKILERNIDDMHPVTELFAIAWFGWMSPLLIGFVFLLKPAQS
jgi:hypothetical protein